MPVKVTVKNDNLSFEAGENESLLEQLKEKTSMLFGCEKGYCGVCVCHIPKGADLLAEKSPEEAEVLDGMAAHPSQRLACKLKIKKGKTEGEIIIEY